MSRNEPLHPTDERSEVTVLLAIAGLTVPDQLRGTLDSSYDGLRPYLDHLHRRSPSGFSPLYDTGRIPRVSNGG